jgi:transcriptional regulator with XRE-family HTH domain
MPRKPTAKRPGEYVGERVRTARVSKRLSQSDLVSRLEELGYTQWRQSKVAKIENGEVKRLALDDVLALAAALGVQPIHLITPTEDEALVEVAPKLTVPAVTARGWLRGVAPISEDGASYFASALTPARDSDDFLDRRYEIKWFPPLPKRGTTFTLGRDAQWHEEGKGRRREKA